MRINKRRLQEQREGPIGAGVAEIRKVVELQTTLAKKQKIIFTVRNSDHAAQARGQKRY